MRGLYVAGDECKTIILAMKFVLSRALKIRDMHLKGEKKKYSIFIFCLLFVVPALCQQLAVTAVFDDGSRRDVTRLARFSVSVISL